MSKIRSLTTVFQVAKHKEQSIGDELKLAEGELSKHQKYLDDLQQYRNNYSEISTEKGLVGVSAAMFRHYQGFLNSIDHGITQQTCRVKMMNDEMQTKLETWQQAHQYSNAIEGLIDKQHLLQEKVEQKREQAMTDEMNLRNYLLNKTNMDVIK